MKCKIIVGGKASGKILVTKQPINFLSSLDHSIGRIVEEKHELFGNLLKNRILIFPYAVGSSVGAYTIFALKSNKVAPSGIICTSKVDLITASGCAIANIPLLELYGDEHIPEFYNYNEGIADGTSGILKIRKV